MSTPEQVLNLMPEVVDLAWNAAQAANQAFDAITQADAAIDEWSAMPKVLGGVCVAREEAFAELAQKQSDALSSFELLTDMAAPIMTMENGPFTAPERAPEPVVVPEIDTATAEKLEKLSPEYRYQVTTKYEEKYRAIEGYIREGKLSRDYHLPELLTFMDDITALEPVFEHVTAVGQPAFEFFPKRLTENEWNTVLSGHKLDDDQLSNGVWRGFDGKPTIPTTNVAGESLWGTVVIDVSEQPAIKGISADGTNAIRGVDLKKTLKTLKAVPGVGDASTPEEIVKKASPSEVAYRGVQLSRIERGEAPLDPTGWTIAKNNVEVDGVLRSVFVDFAPGDRRVDSNWGGRDYAVGGYVVRVSGER